MAGWPLERLLVLAQAVVDHDSTWVYAGLVTTPAAVALFVAGVVLWCIPAAPAFRWLAALLFIPLSLPPTQGDVPGKTRVTVLDVGQGTAAVVESGDRALLYDTGGGDPAGSNTARTVVLPYLHSRSIRELDTLVISHPDLDHSSGVADILGTMRVGRRDTPQHNT